MNYEKELQKLKPYDEVQGVSKVQGYDFITTAGHGYLVVPGDDENYKLAENIREFGYTGTLAIYLEEDCEAGEFLKAIKIAE